MVAPTNITLDSEERSIESETCHLVPKVVFNSCSHFTAQEEKLAAEITGEVSP